jgi:ATP-dependent Clp protease ATP-binding subunit ClpA
MSNYQSTQDIPTLIGSLDKGNPGLLAKAIREMPYGVLLLDEIEKSNANLRNIFLTVLDEGYFTDGFGKRVDCKNLVIIATSNAGSDLIYKQNQIIEDEKSRIDNLSSTSNHPSSSLMNYLIEKKIFSPEFLNRFDGVISFNQLDSDTSVKIAQKMLNQIVSDIEKLHHVKVNFSQDSINKIANQSTNSQFGARNLDRLLRDEIEDKIAKVILEGKTKEGETIFI